MEEVDICSIQKQHADEIERQLAAHMIALLPGSGSGAMPKKGEKLGEASVTYADVFSSEAFHSTIYGKAAMALDTCGALGNLGKKAVSIKSITSFD